MYKLLSVIIPTFDRRYLTDMAVSSVVTAQPSLVEIIVVDDCGTKPYSFESLNTSGVQVNVIRLSTNIGAGMARKIGVTLASGEFIAYLDSDDVYDRAWMDGVIAVLQTSPEVSRQKIVISGTCPGGTCSAIFINEVLRVSPRFLQLFGSRLIVTLFNPFYTPSLVLSKDLCFFKDGLRHCEDYYSNAFALFDAQNIHLSKLVACHLGRTPNSAGGESYDWKKMFIGELQVRFNMLKARHVPLIFKCFVIFGIVYQCGRFTAKRAIRMII